ncbi:MAG TPA: DUF4058 family protein [Pirellulales bacterium]|nr:DUF4058 family protein [Pirellulales bacterium]
MASPFPGMDPFLENPAYWLDFHSRFVNCWCEAIADVLPASYEAGIGERVYLIEHDPDVRKLCYPDMALTGEKTQSSVPPLSAGGLATLDPVTVPLMILEGPRESYIEILHHPDRTLVAVLEFLSPANKEYPGRTEYLAKRMALLKQNVHMVELDLLLGGRRLPMQEPLPPADCFYLVSRAERRPDCQVYRWTVKQPLSKLPVPLRAPDADILIDLAAVFTVAYQRGRFKRRINYQAPAPAALSDDDRRWAAALVAGRQ